MDAMKKQAESGQVQVLNLAEEKYRRRIASLDDCQFVKVRFELAALVGINEAMVLDRLEFWMSKAKEQEDGFRWVYNSYTQWHEILPVLSTHKIQRAFQKLEKMGLVISREKGKSQTTNRTKEYRLDFDALLCLEQKNGITPLKLPVCTGASSSSTGASSSSTGASSSSTGAYSYKIGIHEITSGEKKEDPSIVSPNPCQHFDINFPCQHTQEALNWIRERCAKDFPKPLKTYKLRNHLNLHLAVHKYTLRQIQVRYEHHLFQMQRCDDVTHLNPGYVLSPKVIDDKIQASQIWWEN